MTNLDKWLHLLHDQPGCTDFLHELLDIIENYMLVANEKDRTDAKDLVSKFKRITEKGQRDYLYWSQPRLRKREPPSLNCVINQRLIQYDARIDSLSTLDKWRVRIEQYVGHEVDWHPPPPLNRLRSPLHAKLVWEVRVLTAS